MSTKIQWCDEVWNPVVGCRPVSPGCANCYAARMALRLEGMGTRGYMPLDGVRIAVAIEGGPARFTGSVRCVEDELDKPRHWRKPRRVFLCSMGDLFYGGEDDKAAARKAGIPFMPVPLAFIDRVFETMRACPQHTFMLLTKRPEEMVRYFYACELSDKWVMPGNVILGVSVESGDCEHRIDALARCPAAGYFVSYEPLLWPPEADLHSRLGRLARAAGSPDRVQVIIGGESGPGSRPCYLENIRDVIGHADAAGVRVFVKQLGSKPRAVGPEQPSMRMAVEKNNGVYERWYKPADGKGGDPSEWPSELRRFEQVELVEMAR